MCLFRNVLFVSLMLIASSVSASEQEITIKSASPFILPDLLDGLKNDPPVVIKGKLVLPDNTSLAVDGKFPVMVQSHGSGGLKHETQINKYGKSFLENGIGYFYIDHFAPRYAVSTVGNQAKVTGTSMTADVFKILETLSSHPKVDPKRIGIIGWSKGGGVALYSAMKPYRDGVLDSDMKFALHVALYPPCIFDWKMKTTGAPMRMILAEKENWTGLKGCISTAKRYKGQGLDVEAILLPGAYHGFDSWGARDKGVRDNNKAWGYGKCDLVGNEDGSITDRLSGLSYDSKTNRRKIYKGCISRGITGGFDIKSAKTSLRLVTQFVTTNFGK